MWFLPGIFASAKKKKKKKKKKKGKRVTLHGVHDRMSASAIY